MNISILFIVMAILLVYNIVDGYRKGMVRQFISFVSLVILCVILALIANGLNSYINGRILNVLLVVILLCVLGIAKHVLGVVFFSAKAVSKLPVIHGLDKIMGVAFGILETIAILWTIYTFTMMMDLGAIGSMIKSSVAGNPILEWCYRHNYLAYWIENLTSEIALKYKF